MEGDAGPIVQEASHLSVTLYNSSVPSPEKRSKRGACDAQAA